MRFSGSQWSHTCFYLVVAIGQVFCKTCPPLRSDTVDISCDYDGDTVNCGSPIFRGTKARLACKESFSISTADDPGYRELTCLYSGSWNYPLFNCTSGLSNRNTMVEAGPGKDCPALSSKTVDFQCINNGTKVPCDSAMPSGTKANLACKEFHQILFTAEPGYREITCLEDGKWDHPVFQCVPECGTVLSEGTNLMVNGTKVKHHKYPWRVVVFQKNSTSPFWFLADATLISPDRVIIQAGLIVHGPSRNLVDLSDLEVIAGIFVDTYETSEPYAQKSAIKSIEIAQGYKGDEGDSHHNIAMLRLQTPFEMTALVRPICMDWAQVIGFSDTESQKIVQSYIPSEKCRSQVAENDKRFITDDTFCTDCNTDTTRICTDVAQGGSFSCNYQGLWYMQGRHKKRLRVKTTGCELFYAYQKIGPHLKWMNGP